jgi:hypothetical protein
VPVGQVQEELRRCFERWGRPGKVRFDNGNPWGSCGDMPTPLSLWLVGLGIGVIWNRARRPQDNGVVERSQGVAYNWAEPDLCPDAATLQCRLDEEDQVQRESYPHHGFPSRLEAYPGLAHSGRPSSVGWERAHWSWNAVLDFLAGFMATRQVDGSGKIGFYGGKLYVGTVNRGKSVVVHFDAATAEWVISNSTGVELCRRPLNQFDAASLRNL